MCYVHGALVKSSFIFGDFRNSICMFSRLFKIALFLFLLSVAWPQLLASLFLLAFFTCSQPFILLTQRNIIVYFSFTDARQKVKWIYFLICKIYKIQRLFCCCCGCCSWWYFLLLLFFSLFLLNLWSFFHSRVKGFCFAAEMRFLKKHIAFFRDLVIDSVFLASVNFEIQFDWLHGYGMTFHGLYNCGPAISSSLHVNEAVNLCVKGINSGFYR